MLVFKHTIPDTTFFAPSRLHTICWNVLQGVLVHLTVPKFRQISLGVKCIHAMISIMQTQFPQKRSLLIVYTSVSKYCSKYYVEHSSTCHSDNPDVQFNLDHKSSNANLGLPALSLLLHVATIMLLLGLDLLKYSRSLYDGLLNIKVLYYDPVLLYYCTTGILSSTMGCKMYIRSARYWYAALKPCNKTTETWPSLRKHHMHNARLLLFCPHLSPLNFLCNKEVEIGIHWKETPHANSVCRLLGRIQGIGAMNLAVQNVSRD